MVKVSHDSETPAHGQQVITATAFIHHRSDGVTKVFLPMRAASKKFFPSVYELPGGHIDFGENMIHGLKREVKEELGVDICVGDPFYEFTYHNSVKGSHSIEVIYFAKLAGSAEDIKLEPEDHSEGGWFSREEAIKALRLGRAPDQTNTLQGVLKGFNLLAGDKLNFG